MVEFVLTSEGDTARLARVLASTLSCGVTVGLKGDLGAGKTTLVRYLVEALGGSGAHVASPSFSLQNEYPLANGGKVEHWDLYRLREAPGELSEPPDGTTLRIIEWPERAAELQEELQLLLEIQAQGGDRRTVTCSGPQAKQVERAAMGEFSEKRDTE